LPGWFIKSFGLALKSEKTDGDRIYRIVAARAAKSKSETSEASAAQA
jgi:hypothetical protein